ncbi:HAD hydrolase-like protein [Rufibacter quisquiliarum]|uniref:Beta-phosphoglucomutase-like phosphatase (HAD superfamily) n=1 Tax=Rufibacter quisquiliarum TaxID=1549639 RepID=A0A839GUA4_9BACT|nr:HAD hydrolase-like protein [Rufibacter quisquiliarum]MBA9077988.1 beta-phosphoglucomutase-like phosphatase (HAD superfamily) [Rufibacter quisquiliarum]
MKAIEEPNELINTLYNKVKPNSILFFDLDGTLVDTNFANYLSYKKALQSVLHKDCTFPYNPDQRFNRSLLKTTFINITEDEYRNIVYQKEKNYIEYLPKTELNKSLTNILKHFSRTNSIVLVTNCRKDRALMILNHYELTKLFIRLFFRIENVNNKKVNKYHNAIMNLNVSPDSVIAFENEYSEVNDAINAGIPINNIIIIK